MIKKIEDYIKEIKNAIELNEKIIKIPTNIFRELFTEIEEIKQTKYSGEKNAMLLIFYEQNNKWNTIVEQTDIGLIKNGFINLMKKYIPEIEKLEIALAKKIIK